MSQCRPFVVTVQARAATSMMSWQFAGPVEPEATAQSPVSDALQNPATSMPSPNHPEVHQPGDADSDNLVTTSTSVDTATLKTTVRTLLTEFRSSRALSDLMRALRLATQSASTGQLTDSDSLHAPDDELLELLVECHTELYNATHQLEHLDKVASLTAQILGRAPDDATKQRHCHYLNEAFHLRLHAHSNTIEECEHTIDVLKDAISRLAKQASPTIALQILLVHGFVRCHDKSSRAQHLVDAVAIGEDILRRLSVADQRRLDLLTTLIDVYWRRTRADIGEPCDVERGIVLADELFGLVTDADPRKAHCLWARSQFELEAYKRGQRLAQ